jgi:hypothetical protein
MEKTHSKSVSKCLSFYSVIGDLLEFEKAKSIIGESYRTKTVCTMEKAVNRKGTTAIFLPGRDQNCIDLMVQVFTSTHLRILLTTCDGDGMGRLVGENFWVWLL